MSTELQYSRLPPDDTIRVLTIHPGATNAPIVCSFGFTKLKSPCDYEAISYAWEYSTLTHAVRSRNGRTRLAVPASCYGALSAIRDESRAHVVWIDSICINQSDLAEKATQVALMGKIYAASSCTLVYVGEDDGTFRDLVLALRYLRTNATQAAKIRKHTDDQDDDPQFDFPDAEKYFDDLPQASGTGGRGAVLPSRSLDFRNAGERSVTSLSPHVSAAPGRDEEEDITGESSDEEYQLKSIDDILVQAMGTLVGHSDSSLDYVVTVAYLANEIQYFSQDYFDPLRAFHRSFFQRVWFTRLWVIQEVALSKNVRIFLGRQSASWGTVMALYNLVDFQWHQFQQSYYGHPLVCDRSMLGHHIAEKFMRLDERTTTGYDFGGEQLVLRHRNAFFDHDDSHYAEGIWPFPQDRLLDLLYDMRVYACKDGRDRLYAILSILEGSIPQALKPNYDPSITQGEIFTRIARHQINCGRFDVLAYASGIARVPAELKDMPTWVPNWTDPPDKRLLINATTLHVNITVGTKPGMTSVRAISANSGSEITVRGMIFDEVTYVSVTCPKHASRDDFMRIYSCWIWTRKYVHAPELGSRVHYWLTSKKLPQEFYQQYGEYDYFLQDPLEMIPETIHESEPQEPQSAFANRHATFVSKSGRMKASIDEICKGRAFATVGSPGDEDPEKLEIYETYLSSPYVPFDTSDESESDDQRFGSVDEYDAADRETMPPQRALRVSELIIRDEPEFREEKEEAEEPDASTERRKSKWHPSKARCLVPHGTKEGDLVCGLLGCEVAVILRPHGKRFRFIGTTTCWKFTIAREAPHLDWNNLLSPRPQAPLRDFRIF